MKKKVFICYRQKTSYTFVSHLADRLKELFQVSYDKDHGSGDITEWINRKIDNCTHFILVVDEKTFDFKDDKDYVLSEIRYVLEKIQEGKKIEIIPILVNDYTFPSEEELEKYNIKSIYRYDRYKYKEDENFDAFFSHFLSNKMECNIGFEKRKKIFKLIFLIILLAAISMFGGCCLQQYISTQTIKMIFAGGGSVANMINDLTKGSVNVKESDNGSLYLDLPSKSAWDLLSEEVLLNHTSDTVKNKFYPICLSAMEVEDKNSAFLKYCDSTIFVDKGTIVSYCLGVDTLMIYFKDQKSALRKYGDSIPIDTLSTIIKNSVQYQKGIFCTQKGSGTYHQYKKILQEDACILRDSLEHYLHWYNETSSSSDHFSKYNDYLVLASKYYTPTFLKKEKGICIIDSIGIAVTKPMYLYFAAYKKEGEDKVKIPDQMVRFLKCIIQKNDTLKDYARYIKSEMKYYDKHVTIPIYILLEWERNEN